MANWYVGQRVACRIDHTCGLKKDGIYTISGIMEGFPGCKHTLICVAEITRMYEGVQCCRCRAVLNKKIGAYVASHYFRPLEEEPGELTVEQLEEDMGFEIHEPQTEEVTI